MSFFFFYIQNQIGKTYLLFLLMRSIFITSAQLHNDLQDVHVYLQFKPTPVLEEFPLSKYYE